VSEDATTNQREPIVIDGDELIAGDLTAIASSDRPEDILGAYLKLIRRARGEWRRRSLSLRRVDIEALAEHLEWTEERVIAHLADVMGATSRQRAAMLGMLATGASLVMVAEPAAAASTEPVSEPGFAVVSTLPVADSPAP
jgi:hypothetical protein